MSRGHHVETHTQNQVHSISANVARGRDVLATLAAAWSSSANQLDPAGGADDAPALSPNNESKSEPRPTTTGVSR
jgi:hypothetical protein